MGSRAGLAAGGDAAAGRPALGRTADGPFIIDTTAPSLAGLSGRARDAACGGSRASRVLSVVASLESADGTKWGGGERTRERGNEGTRERGPGEEGREAGWREAGVYQARGHAACRLVVAGSRRQAAACRVLRGRGVWGERLDQRPERKDAPRTVPASRWAAVARMRAWAASCSARRACASASKWSRGRTDAGRLSKSLGNARRPSAIHRSPVLSASVCVRASRERPRTSPSRPRRGTPGTRALTYRVVVLQPSQLRRRQPLQHRQHLLVANVAHVPELYRRGAHVAGRG